MVSKSAEHYSGIKMRLRIFGLLLIILVAFSCSHNKSIKKTQIDNYISEKSFYFPGVDSSVARNANQFSERIIVDFNKRKRAENWFNKGTNSFKIVDSLLIISSNEQRNDSIAYILYSEWSHHYNTPTSNLKSFHEIKTNDFKDVCMTILDTANAEIMRAKLFNPFDLNIRSLLIKIYLKQGALSSNTVYYQHAIEELNNFLLVDKSNPYIYEKLAECFYFLEDWKNSYKFFHNAEEVLKIISKFKFERSEANNAPIDTTRLVYYLRKQGEAKAKIYDSESAIYYLNEAKKLTKSKSMKQELQNILTWINWDDGNIRASEIKDEIAELEMTGDYKKVRGEYLELLKTLKTQKAINEIKWKIASIEYNYLDRKKEALKRLFQVVHQIKKSSDSHPLNTVYLKDYAAMCYSVGMTNFNENRYRLAYIYLNQATRFEWEHKGDCFYQLALLSRESPDETIRNCKEALDHSNQLSEKYKENIYELLAVSYKRQGKFDIANQYFQNSLDNEIIKKNN